MRSLPSLLESVSKARLRHRFVNLFTLFLVFNLSACVNLQYVEALGQAGQLWSQNSLEYIDKAEEAHNSAYQYNKAAIDKPPKCKQGFRLCLRAWERNDKEKRFSFLRTVASLMLVYTQTLQAIASDAPLDQLKRLSKDLSDKMQLTQEAFVVYRQTAGYEPIPTVEKFDVVAKVIYGVSRIHYDYQRDKAIRQLVEKRYKNINRALILYMQAMSALIDSTQVIAGDLHGEFEKFVEAAWRDASKAERLSIMQESVLMQNLKNRVILEKMCPPDTSPQCENDMLEYKLILELQTLIAAHDKLYSAAKSNLPLDFADFSTTVSRLSKF